jgi:transcriptional regulator with GAF, ATPase, and Fis domain
MARSLEEVEAEHIRQVLENTDWIIEGKRGAAAVLGLEPSTLRYRMQKLGIRRPKGGAVAADGG